MIFAPGQDAEDAHPLQDPELLAAADECAQLSIRFENLRRLAPQNREWSAGEGRGKGDHVEWYYDSSRRFPMSLNTLYSVDGDGFYTSGRAASTIN